jgi:Domain of unknown function (DUF4430)
MKKITTILFAVVIVVVLGLLLMVYFQTGNTTATVTTKLTVNLYDAPSPINQGNTTVWTKVGDSWTNTTYANGDGGTIWVFENITGNSNCYDQLVNASVIAGFGIEVDHQPLGLIVTSIADDGNLEHDGRAWQYFVNGVYANRASNIFAISNGDVVEWKYIPNQMSG